jgi:hypothetical protein
MAFMLIEYTEIQGTGGNPVYKRNQNGGYILFIQSLNGVSDRGFVKMKYCSMDFLAHQKGMGRA